MPFRERLKKTFSRSGSKEEITPKDPNVYGPKDKMPRPKYRAPVAREHAEKLNAFSFAAAWRRKSDNSQYSPFGTRAPSRNVSRRQSREVGGSRRGSASSRRGSLTGSFRRRSGKMSRDDGEGVDSEERRPIPAPVQEVLGENGTPIAPGATPPKVQNGKTSPPQLDMQTTVDGQPFTEEELMLAYHKSVASKRSSGRRED
ncbi:MAG: hypothetical protein M1820_005065 [Bogoriella megaspora]|nr:MAG: hypothetical protein M1820_005065 [Bogoriella megaspora]